jgi:hypothetical protein
MTVSTPLVFRPSLTQRALTGLLCAGSWLVGVRGLFLLLTNLPRLHAELRLAAAAGEPTLQVWIWIVVTVVLCLAGGCLLLFSILGLILIEGTQILVDPSGITVEHAGLPRPLAQRLGAGHLPWKYVSRLEKGRIFFVLRGGTPEGETVDTLSTRYAHSTLKFLVVDQLERLILIVLERSSNLTFS